MEERALHLVVKGRVQGVGFRWYVADRARNLGLAGWVRNVADGSVELCASGSARALAVFEADVTKGPPGAQVSNVERREGETPTTLRRPFSIVGS